ncbi:MAG: LptF/LptG family permease [Saprospiraceae bacterium]
MKKIDKLVISNFIGPYLLSFFVAEFVLVMQFLWKFIDEILGKGFGAFDILELVFYFMVTSIPMALPIAILLASVMVYGNLSEQYALSSLKSAGISLMRILRPGIYIALGTAFLSMFASNYLKPQANFQFKKRMRIMKAQKSSLSIEEKIFNRDFNGYVIRVDEKLEDEVSINDILIYDHTANDKSLINMTKANDGKMYSSEDGRYFIMELNNGVSYKELKRERIKGEKNRKKYPFMRTKFLKWKKVFDLTEFDTDDNDMSMNRSAEDMLNSAQLLRAIDSLDNQSQKMVDSVIKDKEIKRTKDEELRKRKNKNLQSNKKRKKSSPTIRDKEEILNRLAKKSLKSKNRNRRIREKQKINQNHLDTLSIYTNWYQTIASDDKNNLSIKALRISTRRKDLLRNAVLRIKGNTKKRGRFLLRLNQQYAFALICIVFLFIGAPLGSIIRKGGYGYPLLIAILFYMLFIITTIMGEKLIKDQKIDPILAAWIANLIVSPVAVWFTIKALKDGKFNFSFGFLTQFFNSSKG